MILVPLPIGLQLLHLPSYPMAARLTLALVPSLMAVSTSTIKAQELFQRRFMVAALFAYVTPVKHC